MDVTDDFRRNVTDALARVERKQDDHVREFRDFRNNDFGAMRERVAKVEIKAGLVALVIGAVVTAVGIWLQSL